MVTLWPVACSNEGIRPFMICSTAPVVMSAISAGAAEIALMTTGAVEQIMKGLIPSFEQATGHKVTMTVLGTGGAVDKIKEGTYADLILLGPPALKELTDAGRVDGKTI